MPDFGSALWNKPPSGDTGEGSGGGSSDPVTRSLRFKDADNSHLYFDPTTTHDSTTVYTFSCWAKLGEMSAESYEIFTAGDYTSSTSQDLIYFGHDSSSKMRVWLRSTHDGTNTNYRSTALFRDPSAWYHLLLVRNGASLKVYVNNSEVISETISSVQRYGVGSGRPMHIGSSVKPTSPNVSSYSSFDGLLADVYFTDGYAKSPTDFIESNGYGGYKPKAYTGSFGTNGFHLKFEDSSDIGADDAGSNDFSTSGLSSHDVMLDVPTKNYCLINPLAETKTDSSSYVGNPTTGLSEGNLKLTSSGNFFNGHGTLGVSSGKWYFEWYSTGDWTQGGFTTREMFSNYSQSLTDFWVLYNQDSSNNIAAYYKNGTGSSSETWAGGSQASGNGNVYGCAFDVDNRKMYFHKNGEWSDGTSTLTSTFPSSYGGDLTGSSHNIPADTTFFPTVRPWTNSTVIANFGQDSTFANTVASGSANAADTNGNGDFRYTPPSGYLALCTASMSAPSVTPSEHFGVLTYVGNSDLYYGSGSTQNVTGVNFDVGMAWIKDRDNSAGSSFTGSGSDEYGHYLFDTITGTSTGGYNIDADVISSSGGPYLNSGEYGVTSFSAGSGTNRGIMVDEAGETNYYYDEFGFYEITERYVAWLWKLGSTGSSSTWNSSYTAPSTEHYNASAGVTTIQVSPATSGNLEVAHSLGAAPEFFFVADDQGYANFSGFPVFHKDLSSGNYLQLDGNSAQSSDSTYFPSGAAHADYIKLGSAFIDDYGYGFNLRIWAFTGVEGYSKFGLWEANGNIPQFSYLGFRPAFVMLKCINVSGTGWVLFDSKRETHNEINFPLYPQSSDAEPTSGWGIDFLSNGFAWRNLSSEGYSGRKYIYAAFAESPFSKSNAR